MRTTEIPAAVVIILGPGPELVGIFHAIDTDHLVTLEIETAIGLTADDLLGERDDL